jgi:hypothetical protein
MTTIEKTARAKTGWFRRAVLGAAFAAVGVLTLGAGTTPAQAWWYGYGYHQYYAYYPHYYGWNHYHPAYWVMVGTVVGAGTVVGTITIGSRPSHGRSARRRELFKRRGLQAPPVFLYGDEVSVPLGTGISFNEHRGRA